MIETMSLHYHCSDWPIWGNFHIKNELDTVRKTYVPLYSQVINADEVRGEAIEAFEKIMQALYQKNLDNLASNMIPIDSKSKIAEDKQILKGLIDSNLQNRNSKKSIEKLEFYVGKLKEENSKNYELLNATSKDVLFVPESVDGQIFWDVRRIVMTGEFRRIFLLYTVPVIALYKKKTLFESVQHLEYVRKGTRVPFIEIPKEYGYSRPVRIAALIQFVNEIPKIGELSLERKLFGFH
uniref:Uncharacterized protein n=1 Tax=Acrobeloides nanus TaxID=290746 RepID=A0A914CYU7_9BILA